MSALFYIAAAVAFFASLLAISRTNAVHGLLYLVVGLLAVAFIFYLFGAPFAAALQVIIYAGAIVVLFLFVVMMLNLGPATEAQERGWLAPGIWLGPGLLALALLGEVLYALSGGAHLALAPGEVGPKWVGVVLFGPYLLAVELASFLLLAALVGAYHLGRRDPKERVSGE